MEKVMVSLPERIVSLIDKDLQGKLGDGRSDVVRSIVLSWLAENGYLENEALFEQVAARLEEQGWVKAAKE